MVLAPLPGCDFPVDSKPRVSHKTLHPGLSSMQPSGLATPEACKRISPGYAFFAYPGKTSRAQTRTPKVVRGLSASLPCISDHYAFYFGQLCHRRGVAAHQENGAKQPL